MLKKITIALAVLLSTAAASAQEIPGKLYIGQEYPGPAFVCDKEGIQALILADMTGTKEAQANAVTMVNEGKCGIVGAPWRIKQVVASFPRLDGRKVVIFTVEFKKPDGQWVDLEAFGGFPGEVVDGDPA